MRRRSAKCAVVLVAGLLSCLWPWNQASAEQVPFVGCASDGQGGPRSAPAVARALPDVIAPYASRLALYASQEIAVLAPRGWRCLGLYGSNGIQLMVRPADFGSDSAAFMRSPPGPSIQVQYLFGDTSGRFSVARIAAPLFPMAHDYVARVIAEGFEPADRFPTSLPPEETLQRRSDTMVETHRVDSFGATDRAVIFLPDDDTSLVQVLVKLSPEQADLLRIVFDWVEKEKAGVLIRP